MTPSKLPVSGESRQWVEGRGDQFYPGVGVGTRTPYGVNVNAICPGLLWTLMWERIAYRRSISPTENSDGLSPRLLFNRAVEATIPKREQTPEDIGNLAAFLASDYSRNITGRPSTSMAALA